MNKVKHVAVIADGNGRWANNRGLSRSEGHEKGLNKIEDMLQWCRDIGIKYFSAYIFSWENWGRPKEEVDALLLMAKEWFKRYKEFEENGIKVVISGTKERIEDPELLEMMDKIQSETSHCTRLTFNICCNYSGRKEIVNAIASGARTEEEITSALYQNLPEPDLIIRTGGFQRLSNFLTWQSVYSELYFTETLFPDFSLGEFKHALNLFGNIKRNWGRITNDERTV